MGIGYSLKEEIILSHYFHPEIRLLLIDQSDQTVQMLYSDNASTWAMPLIGKRPPFYTNPRYTQTFPIL